MSTPGPLRWALLVFPLLAAACDHADPATTSTAPAPSPPASTPSPAPAAHSARAKAPKPPPSSELVVERAIPVGKWPAGIAVHEGDAFVAESGDRQIARVEIATGKIKARIPAGRLPVDLATGPDGIVYALVQTDGTVKAIDPADNRLRTLAVMPDHPQGMAFAGGALWVLLPSSAGSTVVRIDPASGKQTRSKDLGKNPWVVAADGDRVWEARDDFLSVIDARTLERRPDVPLAGRHLALVATPSAVFTSEDMAVVRLDPATGMVVGRTQRMVINERVYFLAAAGSDLLVVGDNGHIVRLDAATLVVKAEFVPEAPFEPHGIAEAGDRILVTDQGSRDGNGDHGTLLVLRTR